MTANLAETSVAINNGAVAPAISADFLCAGRKGPRETPTQNVELSVLARGEAGVS